MSSYRQILYHILFATDQRKPTLDERYCYDLYQYIGGIAKHRNTRIYQVNGVADHIHILCDLHPSISLGDFCQGTQSGYECLDENQWPIQTLRKMARRLWRIHLF